MQKKIPSFIIIFLIFTSALPLMYLIMAGLQSKVFGANFYFHRDSSGINSYRTLNTQYPIYSDSNRIIKNVPVGVWEVGDGWITHAFPFDINLTRSYNFLFSIWSGGNGNATLFFKFYAFRNGNEHFLFTSNPSEQFIVNATEMLWQHKTKQVTLQIKQGDRLVLRLYINVTVAGTFGLGYDCTQYPSYVNDPTEMRYMRSDTASINGATFYNLGTSQTASIGSGQKSLASVTSSYLYPTSDSSPLEWTPTPSGTHYTCIDETVASDVDYVSATVVGDAKIDRYGKTTLSGATGIARVAIIIRRKGGDSIDVGLVIGGTFYSQRISAGGASYETTIVSWDLSPATGVLWTQTEVNNAYLQIQQIGGAGQVAYVSQLYIRIYKFIDNTIYYGYQVWKRSSGGTDTEITSGVETFLTKTIVDFCNEGGQYRTDTWDCPETDLDSTDSVVLGVYYKVGAGSWLLHTTYRFSTEQLGADSLNATTWTLYFWLESSVSVTYVYSVFFFGSSTYNSRIENFVWTAAPSGEELSFSFIETTHMMASLNQWQEHRYSFQQIVVISEITFYFGEGIFMVTETLKSSDQSNYWQERAYALVETMNLSTTINYWIEELITFWEYSFIDAIDFSTTLRYSIETTANNAIIIIMVFAFLLFFIPLILIIKKRRE